MIRATTKSLTCTSNSRETSSPVLAGERRAPGSREIFATSIVGEIALQQWVRRMKDWLGETKPTAWGKRMFNSGVWTHGHEEPKRIITTTHDIWMVKTTKD